MFIIFMSPRPLRLRKISNPPIISGFKPYGGSAAGRKPESVFLHLEEYEAIRLCDFDMLNQHDAAVIMNVSRPTLTRIYARARQKVAEALVLGKQLIIEGGKIYFDSEWYHCRNCDCNFNNPQKQIEITQCPLCKSLEVENCASEKNEKAVAPEQNSNRCYCSQCGYEPEWQTGKPCRRQFCPQCNIPLIRKVPRRHRGKP